MFEFEIAEARQQFLHKGSLSLFIFSYLSVVTRFSFSLLAPTQTRGEKLLTLQENAWQSVGNNEKSGSEADWV